MVEAGRIELPSEIEQPKMSTCLAVWLSIHSTFIRSKNKVELDHFYFILNTWTLLRLVYVDDAPRFNHRQIISGTSC